MEAVRELLADNFEVVKLICRGTRRFHHGAVVAGHAVRPSGGIWHLVTPEGSAFKSLDPANSYADASVTSFVDLFQFGSRVNRDGITVQASVSCPVMKCTRQPSIKAERLDRILNATVNAGGPYLIEAGANVWLCPLQKLDDDERSRFNLGRHGEATTA